MLYFTELANEVGVRKGQRLQDCCPVGATRSSARQGKRGCKTQRGQDAQRTSAAEQHRIYFPQAGATKEGDTEEHQAFQLHLDSPITKCNSREGSIIMAKA